MEPSKLLMFPENHQMKSHFSLIPCAHLMSPIDYLTLWQ